jgi:hypothetical protein
MREFQQHWNQWKSIRLGSGSSDLLLFTKRDAWTCQEFLVSFSLIGLDLLQHGTEPLVGHDVAVGDAALLVDGVEGKTALRTGSAPPVCAIRLLIVTPRSPARAGAGKARNHPEMGRFVPIRVQLDGMRVIGRWRKCGLFVLSAHGGAQLAFRVFFLELGPHGMDNELCLQLASRPWTSTESATASGMINSPPFSLLDAAQVR